MPCTASLSDRLRRWLIHNDENPFCTPEMRASLVKGLLRFFGHNVLLRRAVRSRSTLVHLRLVEFFEEICWNALFGASHDR